jgi:hypothetical protein
MRYYLDTEFIEFPNTIQLISIGIKSEDGREYYSVSSAYEFDKASKWVIDNVIIPIYKEQSSKEMKSLGVDITNFHKYVGKDLSQIKEDILAFVGFPDYPKGEPEFWTYYGAYDWVVFCWIFGRMIDLPKGFPMYSNDLKQLSESLGGVNMKSPDGEHNALVDAVWNEKYHKKLMGKSGS